MKRTYLYSLLGLMLATQFAGAQGIKIMAGTTFKLTGGSYDIVLHNGVHFQNNVPIQNKMLIIKATGSGSSELRGSGALQVNQILVNKQAGQSIVLQKNVNVAEGILFSTGLLNLNGFDIILADTASLVNETEASHISGTSGGVQITQNLNAPLAENPGNLGLSITSGADWGNTVIRRTHSIYANAGGGGSVSRSFQVTPTNNTGLGAFLRMYYLDAELNGLNESSLDFYRSDNAGSSFTNIGAASRNTTLNFININGLNTVSLLTLGTITNPLPIGFRDINAFCVHHRAQLQWQFDEAEEGAVFRIDKSTDGRIWETIEGDIVLHQEQGKAYEYVDMEEPSSFYRVEYVRRDGGINFSAVQKINCTDEGFVFQLLQNPVGNNIPVSVQAGGDVDLVLSVFDIQGRLMLQQPQHISAGKTKLDMDVSGMATGMYIIQARSQQELLWQSKFVK
jgi:hypothetical protein